TVAGKTRPDHLAKVVPVVVIISSPQCSVPFVLLINDRKSPAIEMFVQPPSSDQIRSRSLCYRVQQYIPAVIPDRVSIVIRNYIKQQLHMIIEQIGPKLCIDVVSFRVYRVTVYFILQVDNIGPAIIRKAVVIPVLFIVAPPIGIMQRR